MFENIVSQVQLAFVCFNSKIITIEKKVIVHSLPSVHSFACLPSVSIVGFEQVNARMNTNNETHDFNYYKNLTLLCHYLNSKLIYAFPSQLQEPCHFWYEALCNNSQQSSHFS